MIACKGVDGVSVIRGSKKDFGKVKTMTRRVSRRVCFISIQIEKQTLHVRGG